MSDCITNNLVINIEGKGSVSPLSGDYCNDTTVILTPTPANGYFFKEWGYIGTDILEDADLLFVPMSINREVTAIFEQVPGYELSDYSLFYCPSETNKTNTIDFEYTNSADSGSNRFHFRAIFYTNAAKTNTLYVASSLIDNKRWYYNDTNYKQIPINGVQINVSATMNITYEPEILPQELIETQKGEVINIADNEEFSLICGNSYYVDIEGYNTDNGNLGFIKSISMIVDCEDVDAFYRSYDNDKNNWICSANGNSDLKVSGNMDQSLFPVIASNNFGIFQIIWQSRRKNVNVIYGAQWDSENDLLYSSGQGMYDKRFLEEGYNPIVLKDLANNFYISSNNRDIVYYNSYKLPVEDIEKPVEITDQTFEKLCYPGQTNFLTSTIEDIKIRVYEEDTDDSIVINKDKVMPIINKQLIRFDIDGINGLYAVRIRDSNDSQWSDWINIDVILPLTEGEDVVLDAYKIGDSRAIIPWNLDRINGVRRICFQLLTLYGISPSICIDAFMNMDIIEYIFEFYKDPNFNELVPIYNGFQLLSQIRDEDGNIIGNNEDGTTTVYFKVIFSEDILIVKNNINYYGNDQYSDGDFIFNVVQQGINDIWGEILERIDNKTFKGEFKIYKNDGVFNKDGKSFIQLIFPDSIETALCISDNSDIYNLMVNSTDVNKFKGLKPEEAFKQNKKNQILKVLDINSFKQYYDKDDTNFRFGNPIVFRNDTQKEING